MPHSPKSWSIADRPWRLAVVLLSLTMLVEYAIMLVIPARLEDWIGPVGVAAADALLLTLLLAPCLWWVVVNPLRRLAAARRQLLDWAMQSEERRAAQIARDLHDGAGQLAAALTVGLRSIEEHSSDPAVLAHARHLRTVGRQLHETIRTVSRGLRPHLLDEHGLAAAVANFAAETSQTLGVNVTADVSLLPSQRLTPAVETAMFRIVQEAVANALQHGAPMSVHVRLWQADDRICLDVTDDGCGFDVERTTTYRPKTGRVPFGLSSIRERAELLGGKVEIQSRPGAGTSIQACFR